jgi:predicted ribosomally synthesized peptide with SipW-like signal peptide
MNKKKVFALALAVCMIAILSMSTLAWFNDSEEIKNDFMFDDTDKDGTVDFKVNLFEMNGTTEVNGKTYAKVTPNAKLAKDPTVKNEGDYAMYTRVVVTISDADAWLKASGKYDLPGNDNDLTILEKMIDLNADWVRFDNPVRNVDADTVTYVYYYAHKVVPGAVSAPVFTEVTIPWQLQTKDPIVSGKEFSITVKADAIQADNIIPENPIAAGNDAYKAFYYANWAAGNTYQPEP